MLVVVVDVLMVVVWLLVVLVVVGKEVEHLAHQRVLQQIQEYKVRVAVVVVQETM
jgi:hypothetical protein